MDVTSAPQNHAAVVGLQWGDEGKGKVVDLLSEHYDYIVRYNGGANAGHTVVADGERYALHLVPSGVLYPGKTNVIGNGVVIDPPTLLDEIDTLRSRGIAVGENLRISDRAHVVLPYHRQEEALLEAAIEGRNKKIGTTGRGIGPAYADKATRSTAIRVGELLRPESVREKIRTVAEVKNAMFGALASVADQPFDPIDPERVADEATAAGERLRPHICDTMQVLHGAMDSGQRLLFEGANASMLDIDHGTYPFVTSSNCSALGVYPGAGVPGRCVGSVIGILKAYTTRVGGGPFPTELNDAAGQRIRDRGNEYGTTTGRPRRCGWLDLVAVRYAARLSGATSLAVMLFDVLGGFDTLRICTEYRHRGRTLDAFPADASVLSEVEPVYEELDGFTEDVGRCRTYSELPAAARRYIERIEEGTDVPVGMVSVGPERSQTLVRDTRWPA